MVCDAPVTSDNINKINHNLWVYLTMPLEITMDCVILLGVIIIFGFFHTRTKPVFVKVIWILLVLCALSNIMYVVSRNKAPKLDTKRSIKALHVESVTIVITQILSQIIHWLFAEQYFAAVLRFPLVIDADKNLSEAEMKKKSNRVWLVLLIANVIFYASVASFTIFVIVNENRRDSTASSNFLQQRNAFDLCIKAASATILLVSILKFRWNAESVKNHDFFKSERMMIYHVSIFLLFILAYIALIISVMFLNHT